MSGVLEVWVAQMMPDGLDFLIMLAGVPFIGFAAACLSLSREMHEQFRWEWLSVFGAMICIHLWLELGVLLAPGVPHQLIQNVLMIAAFLCLYGFAATGAMSGIVLRATVAYMVLAGLLSALLTTQGAMGRDATAGLVGIPATTLACWGLHKWAGSQAAYPRRIALILAAGLPFVVLSELLLGSMGPDFPTWTSTIVFLVVGVALALSTVSLNAYLLGRHSSAVARSYALHVILLAAVLSVILGAGWLVISKLTLLERLELRANAEKRDLPTAMAVRAANETAMRIAVALSAEPSIIAALHSPVSSVDLVNSELDRYAVAFNCRAAFVLDASGKAIATSNRSDPDSVLGRNFAHREYFSQALAGQVNSSILRSEISRTRGLFAAAPVYTSPRRTVGAASVAIALDDMEDEWDPAANMMLVDSAGKVWMTSNPRWLYQQLWQEASVGTTQPIEQVDLRFGTVPDRSFASGDVIPFASVPHLVTRTPAGPQGFALFSLTSMQPIQRDRGVALVVTASLAAMAIVVAMSMRLRADTEMARRQQQLLTTSISEMERVMSVLSHDLRSPLAASKATVDYLLMTENLDGETKGCLNAIGDEQMRMADMVTRLLDAIRIRNGGVEWKWERINAREVIESSFRTVAALPQRRTEVAVDLRIESLPETMHGDSQAINRLIVNLGANAVRHTFRGSVRVCASRAHSPAATWLKIEVRDSGEGIGPAVLPLLGKPFVLGGKSSAAGSGLGLAIASGICAAHGGRLTVQSRLGEGSVFTAWLRTDLDQPVRSRTLAAIEVVDSV